MRAIISVLTLGLLLPSATQAAPPVPQLRLGDIRAQLYYSWTGTLSENILKPGEQYSGWNECAQEGAPNDLLVTVPLINSVRVGQDGETNSTLPIAMIARSGTKVLAQRSVTNMLISHQGVAYAALWLRDVTCGPVDIAIEVRMGNQRKTASLSFDGGE